MLPRTLLSDTTPLPSAVTAPTSHAVAHVSAEGTVVRTIVGLAIVLAVIYGLYWLLRANARARGGSSDDRIAVVASTGLGANRTLHLVRCGEELLLLGAADGGISKLGTYEPEDGADDFVPIQHTGSLVDRLKKLTERR